MQIHKPSTGGHASALDHQIERGQTLTCSCNERQQRQLGLKHLMLTTR